VPSEYVPTLSRMTFILLWIVAIVLLWLVSVLVADQLGPRKDRDE
jgi:hypothetical protein